MVLCCVAYGCNSRYVKGGGITFHKFPKDPYRRKLWELQLKRKDFTATDYSSICSKHFTPECFDTNKFGGTWLKADAYPTIFNFPEYMQKINSSRKNPCIKSIEKEPIQVENQESTSNEDKERYKRLHFMGDFTEKDMESPENAKLFFSIVKNQVPALQQKIKTLNKKNRRQEEKISSLKNIVRNSKNANLPVVMTSTRSVSKNMAEKKESSILEFLMLVGKLKNLKRTGWVLRNIPECESVAGHMYRMSIMAFLLDRSELPNINKDRCIKMALIHDIAECIVGDLTPFCGVSKEEKHRREVAAMERLCGLVGKESGEEIFNLFMEYENQETGEAKAVKDLDKFDMILQAYEYEMETNQPKSLQGFFDNTEGTFTNYLVSKWVKELNKRRETTSKTNCS